MRLAALAPEVYGGFDGFPRRQETLREYIVRHTRTTGSAFKRVQRRCNYGLTNAEWNALTFEQRATLNKRARQLRDVLGPGSRLRITR